MYELIGIYSSYCIDKNADDFVTYFKEHVNKHPYHYRNIGERLIKANFLRAGKDIPRRNFRLLSRTYKMFPVVASSDMGEIFCEIIDYIYKVPAMLERLQKELKQPYSPLNTLIFQYDFLNQYVNTIGCINSIRKKNIFKEVLETWKSNRIFK